MVKLRSRTRLAASVILACVLVPCTLFAGETLYSFEIVNCYPHDPGAFTQGLVFYGGFLYEGTGLYGQSSLRKIRWKDGEVLEEIGLPDHFFGEGVTILDERIFQLTWRENKGFVYDLATLEQIDAFSFEGEGWGLTTDGEYLIMSDGSDVLTYLDPESYEPVKQLKVSGQQGPVQNLNELEYVNGEIFSNIWYDHRICRIDPVTGTVLGWIDLSNLYNKERAENSDIDVVNGIAYDQDHDRLFVTGKLWSRIYEIRLEARR